MTPIEWAKRPLENFADFSGRASRPEYWWFVLAYMVVYIGVQIVESVIGINHLIGGVYGPVTLLLSLVMCVPGVAVTVRRLHDTDRSGWWALAGLIPLVNFVVLYFLVLPGTEGVNQFGSPPSADGEPATQA